MKQVLKVIEGRHKTISVIEGYTAMFDPNKPVYSVYMFDIATGTTWHTHSSARYAVALAAARKLSKAPAGLIYGNRVNAD